MESMLAAIETDDDVITIAEPKVDISDETREKLLSLVAEESQVVVHCKLSTPYLFGVGRIWETTYLVDKASIHMSRLLYADGIAKFPFWTPIPKGTTLCFSLIFSALPKSCLAFEFLENTIGVKGFHIPVIKRNATDVYNIDLSESAK